MARLAADEAKFVGDAVLADLGLELAVGSEVLLVGLGVRRVAVGVTVGVALLATSGARTGARTGAVAAAALMAILVSGVRWRLLAGLVARVAGALAAVVVGVVAVAAARAATAARRVIGSTASAGTRAQGLLLGLPLPVPIVDVLRRGAQRDKVQRRR